MVRSVLAAAAHRPTSDETSPCLPEVCCVRRLSRKRVPFKTVQHSYGCVLAKSSIHLLAMQLVPRLLYRGHYRELQLARKRR